MQTGGVLQYCETNDWVGQSFLLLKVRGREREEKQRERERESERERVRERDRYIYIWRERKREHFNANWRCVAVLHSKVALVGISDMRLAHILAHDPHRRKCFL